MDMVAAFEQPSSFLLIWKIWRQIVLMRFDESLVILKVLILDSIHLTTPLGTETSLMNILLQIFHSPLLFIFIRLETSLIHNEMFLSVDAWNYAKCCCYGCQTLFTMSISKGIIEQRNSEDFYIKL